MFTDDTSGRYEPFWRSLLDLVAALAPTGVTDDAGSIACFVDERPLANEHPLTVTTDQRVTGSKQFFNRDPNTNADSDADTRSADGDDSLPFPAPQTTSKAVMSGKGAGLRLDVECLASVEADSTDVDSISDVDHDEADIDSRRDEDVETDRAYSDDTAPVFAAGLRHGDIESGVPPVDCERSLGEIVTDGTDAVPWQFSHLCSVKTGTIGVVPSDTVPGVCPADSTAAGGMSHSGTASGVPGAAAEAEPPANRSAQRELADGGGTSSRSCDETEQEYLGPWNRVFDSVRPDDESGPPDDRRNHEGGETAARSEVAGVTDTSGRSNSVTRDRVGDSTRPSCRRASAGSWTSGSMARLGRSTRLTAVLDWKPHE